MQNEIHGRLSNFRLNNCRLDGQGGSGNATAADLTIGKTASVDAGDIIGTGTNAKRYATGNANSDVSGNFVVTGLTFRPAYFILWLTTPDATKRFNSYIYRDASFPYHNGTSLTYTYGYFHTNASGTLSGNTMGIVNNITNDGYSGATPHASTNYTWAAYE